MCEPSRKLIFLNADFQIPKLRSYTGLNPFDRQAAISIVSSNEWGR